MSLDNLGSDNVLVEKLKRENPEQFHTLVRMHLSFVLDLHTDDNECTAEKNKFKKWSIFPKKSKNRGVMEGAPLTQEGICQVYQLIEFLSKESNICQEGIFRRTGSLNRQQELKVLLNSGVTLDLDSGSFSVHDCASVLKGFLAELPEPLLTDAHYPAHCQIAELCGGVGKNKTITNEPKLLRALQLLLLLLPPENRVLLKDILELLNLVASYENKNKMSADSLATLFTPHLLCPRKLSPEDLHTNSQTMSCLVSFMIKKCHKLFEIPPKLATDIRAYLLEREKKKILSPAKDLNESITDRTAANTVYTFVDRERTAQAHISNPTEAALAQLYAHIQSLPESSKKKKLIKQFNKENGHGTPLQFQIRNQNKNIRGKSLGDSIKKHIFQKSLSKNMKKTSLLLTPVSTHCLNGTSSTSRSSSEEIVNTPNRYSCITSNKSNLTLKPDTTTSFLSKNFIVQSDEQNLDDEIDVKPISTKNSVETVDDDVDLSSSLSVDDQKLLPPPTISVDYYKTPKNHNSSTILEQKNLWNCNYLTSTPANATTWLSKTTGGSTGDGDDLFTPELIGRKSMSPITRSTRRMSKAMQESMMTPRSRKPVLLISGTNICKLASIRKMAQNNIINRHCAAATSADDSSNSNEHLDQLFELPKNVTCAENNSVDNNSDTPSSDNCDIKIDSIEIIDDHSFEEMSKDELSSLKESVEDQMEEEGSCDTDNSSDSLLLTTENDGFDQNDHHIENKINNTQNQYFINNTNTSSCLSNSFRNYLLTRSVITTSPRDLSFQSREGDFDSLPDELDVEIDTNKSLSDSLLYCLDGNNPNSLVDNNSLSTDQNSPGRKRRNCNESEYCRDANDQEKVIDTNTVKYSAPKELKLKLRKLSQTGDIVYETSL